MLMGGKRLRAGILCLVYEATSGKSIERVLDLACAIELAHSASLIIDDMLDEDEERRGAPTIHLTEGHKRAMLDTVGVLSLPYDLAVPFGEDYVQSLAETQRGMVTGVLKELFHRPDLPASMIYDLIIGQKTGRAFGLASSWGYIAGLNGSRPGGTSALGDWREYGTRVGKAMQIADDIADLRLVMSSNKRSGLGSEILLFRCVTAESLAQELFSDIRKLDLHIEKARDLWSSEGAQRSLRRRLDTEIVTAERLLRELMPASNPLSELLLLAPSEIADIMLGEGGKGGSVKGGLALPSVASSSAT
jgi:geranylgeranyl diphosphate synthase type II